MQHEIIFREQYGALGRRIVYIKPPGMCMSLLFIWFEDNVLFCNRDDSWISLLVSSALWA